MHSPLAVPLLRASEKWQLKPWNCHLRNLRYAKQTAASRSSSRLEGRSSDIACHVQVCYGVPAASLSSLRLYYHFNDVRFKPSQSNQDVPAAHAVIHVVLLCWGPKMVTTICIPSPSSATAWRTGALLWASESDTNNHRTYVYIYICFRDWGFQDLRQ